MPILSAGRVLDPSYAGSSDGSNVPFSAGRANEMLVSELHGKYFQQCYRGNVYYASTATSGHVVPISSTTASPIYTLWNPASSGKLLVPIVTLIGWTATTAALGSFVWMATTNAGDHIGTAHPIVTFTGTVPLNANLGSGKRSQMRFGVTVDLIAATTFYRSTGCSITPTTAATSVAPGWMWRDEWDGAGIVPPGCAIHLMGTTAIAVTAQITTAYAEVPI